MKGLVEQFYLYGEPPADVAPDFLHVETIHARAHPAGGQIRPHMHNLLNHILLIATGEGTILTDDKRRDFTAPHLIFMPAGLIHGFEFSPRVSGHIVTSASAYLNACLAGDVSLPVTESLALALDKDWRKEFRFWAERLMRELVWQAPLRSAAMEVSFRALLISLARLLALRETARAEAPAARHLLARFRALVEQNFRENLPLSEYLARLKVSEAQLRYACAKAGENAPAQIILARRMIEAKRMLIYSDMPVAACGESLGFADPAYFSRQFCKATGQAPSAYRRLHRH